MNNWLWLFHSELRTMARFLLLLPLGSFLCLLTGPSLTALPGNAMEGPSQRKVEQWIEDLGSNIFERREAATHALMELEDEPPKLRKALKSSDLEVRRRVVNILETYVSKRARRGLAKVQALAKEGRVDEMIERMVLWRERLSKEAEWRDVVELAVRLVEWEHRAFGNTQFLSKWLSPYIPSQLRRKNRISEDDVVSPNELAALWMNSCHSLGHEIVLDRMSEVEMKHHVILASERISTPFSFGSIIISGGSIHMLRYGPNYTIIICDGDLEVGCGILNCLVIARGKVICHRDSIITSCTILSGDSFVCDGSAKVENTAILSRGPILCPKGFTVRKKATFRECIPNSPVKFFDPETAGLTIWQVHRNNGALRSAPSLVATPDGSQIHDLHAHPDLAGGVQIKEIRQGTPFAAGLRAGDIITAMDEMKTLTKEVFRKVLRRKLAEGGPRITFTVQRAGKTMDVPIPVKD